MNNVGFHCHGLDHFEEAILSNGLQRGEFYNFPEHQLAGLKKEISRHDLAMSIHAPLLRPSWYPTPPTWCFLCDIDEARMQLSLRMIQETLEMAVDFGAEYVVVHYPTPSWTDISNVTYDEQRKTAWQGALHLAELSQKYNMPVHIEGFGPSPFLAVDFLAEVITEFPCLRYCFDTGHMHISANRDGFDLYEFAQQMAPYIGSIHLWNNRGLEDYLKFHHISVHPSQKPEEGWADIAQLLRLIISNNSSSVIILESAIWYPEALGDYDFRDGVEWIKELAEILY
jgi:sugar phosphate isomerase/epimerase